MFYIGFITASRVDAHGVPHAEGELTAGTHDERFRSDLRVWRKADYERQWRQGVARLLSGAESSVLVTSFAAPDPDGGLQFIPMWREGGTVYVGEAREVTEPLPEPFDVATVYELVEDRVPEIAATRPLTYGHVPLGQLTAFTLEE